MRAVLTVLLRRVSAKGAGVDKAKNMIVTIVAWIVLIVVVAAAIVFYDDSPHNNNSQYTQSDMDDADQYYQDQLDAGR